MMQWKNWSIASRLNFITTLPVALMFSSVVWYSYYSGLAEAQEELAEHGRVIAAALAESSEYGIISGNLSDLERVVRGLVQSDPDIYRIDILGANRRAALHVTSLLPGNVKGRVFEASVRRQLLTINAFGEDGFPHVSSAKDATPPVANPEIIGYVWVSMSPSNMLDKQTRRFNILLAMALLVLGASLLFAYFLSRSLTKPIARSIDALRRIRGGNYAVYVDVTAAGEIGDLQSSINEMSVSLSQSKQDLEQKVIARTRALEASRNEALKSDAEKRKLIQKVNSVVEDERKSIAMEIHDELNATLIGARLDSQRIVDLATEATAGPVMDEIGLKAQRIIKLTSNLYASARDIVRRLRPEVLDMLGLQGAVEEMVRHYDAAHPDCRFDVWSEGDFSKLESAFAITAYRLIQEALSNVVKHAAASQASVSLLLNEEMGVLQITVTDNGAGFDPDAVGPGIGIIGMRERVYAFNGQIKIRTEPNGGAAITIRLPLFQGVGLE